MNGGKTVKTETVDLCMFTEVSQMTKTYVKKCFVDVNENTFSIISLRMIEKINNVKCIKGCRT